MGEVDDVSDPHGNNEERDELEVERVDDETPPSPPPAQQAVIVQARMKPPERIARTRTANKQVVLTDEEPSSPG
jgi:hypothetical protein